MSVNTTSATHRRGRSKLGISAAVAATLVVASLAFWQWPRSDAEPSTSVQPQLPALTDFVLTSESGETFRSSEVAGQIWIGSYFFTECGGNCRLLNMELSKLQQEYGPRGVRFVSFTCDPRTDTPETLAKYAGLVNANPDYWTFLTGELDYLQRVGSDLLEITVSERAHHASFTIVDRDGDVVGMFHAGVQEDLQRARQALEKLLAEQSAEVTEVTN